MFALIYKQPYIVKEAMTKNCTCQTWRGKQLAISESKELLTEYMSSLPLVMKNNCYIEKMATEKICV